MLIYSMSVSVDGFIYDRDGDFTWSAPTEERFAFHTEEVRALGAHLCGRTLHETMLVWETDPAMRSDPAQAVFADLWTALPKVVFSRTVDAVEGENARLATGSLAEEVAAAQEATDGHVAIGGGDLGAQAVALGLVDELRMFRHPVVVGGGRPSLPAVTEKLELELLETRTFEPGGVVLERYGRRTATS